MFERINSAEPEPVTIYVDGRPVAARAADTVAVALLAAGVLPLRVNASDGALRAPYCLMGVCYECRIEIDGAIDAQACVTPVRNGMRITLGQKTANG
jgi:predicted molibdopterin-dependent oxidoreductase YjgC